MVPIPAAGRFVMLLRYRLASAIRIGTCWSVQVLFRHLASYFRAAKIPTKAVLSCPGKEKKNLRDYHPYFTTSLFTLRMIDDSKDISASAARVEDGALSISPKASKIDVSGSVTAAETSSYKELEACIIPTTGPTAKHSIGARPSCFKNTAQEVSFVAQATMAMATGPLFQGACSVITASIGHDLGMTQGQITWITASTALTAGAFQLGLGQLADLLGRKALFIIGMGSFSAFCLLVAFARTPFWMDVVCGIIGISAAMVVPPAIGIMGAAYSVPSKRKNLAFSSFSAGNPLGFVFGTITGGVATQIFNWRATYIFLCILWALFTMLAVWMVPRVEAYPPGEPLRTRLRTFVSTFDFLGTFLTVTGCGFITAAIT